MPYRKGVIIPPILVYIVAGLLGLAFGSFSNVLLLRMAKKQTVRGRSRCPKCKKTLQWFDLIPLFSFIFLGGRCRYCHKPISWRYPIIEASTATLFLFAVCLAQGDLLYTLGLCIFLWGLLLAALFDAKSGLLPDAFTTIIFIGALIIVMALGTYASAMIGGLIGFCWFGFQWLISRGRFVGSGDIFLAGSIGIALGTVGTISMLVLSYITGSAVALVLIAKKRLKRKSQVPFGPFLAIGTLLTLFGVGQIYIDFIT